jgi:SAM-dependent methyltransferase
MAIVTNNNPQLPRADMPESSLTACPLCGSKDLVRVDTYKRVWQLCKGCGAGHPAQKRSYPLGFIPHPSFRRRKEATEDSMYDYFVHPSHIEYSIGTAHEFLRDYVDPLRIELVGKRVLDVSGGNGHFLKVLAERGAVGVLTEINKPSIEYVRKKHGFETLQFDFNRDRLSALTADEFDIVLLRAAIMFCRDLPGFIADVRQRVGPRGLVVVNHSVKPTLGVLCRVQLDEFSYMVLRQPETVISDFDAAGFEVAFRRDETDQSDYVYDHDLVNSWMLLHYFYEIKGALALRKHRVFDFPARDRRRSTIVFRKKS